MKKKTVAIVGGVLTAALAALWLVTSNGDSRRDEHEPREANDGAAKGPHGGRLLRDGDFAIEVTIYERGVPPEFRVYPFQRGAPLDPADVQLGITLHRFGGRIDRFHFEKREDYLIGDHTVHEPHSFVVEVVAGHGDGEHRWSYESYEGRTEMPPGAIASSRISIETVGPATIRETIKAYGRIVPNEDHLAHVIPRYPGIVREVRKRLGDEVAKGDVFAIVESNQSLQPYEVRSPIAGTVIGKDVTSGEFAREGDVIYTVADLGTVWADLNVSHQDFQHLKPGQPVSLETSQGIAKADGRIIYLSPFGAENTQTLLARVEVPNPGGEWRPGLFVTGEILVGEAAVTTAVKTSALQTFRDWTVVFLNQGNVFQAMPVELGRREAEWVEVVEGVEAGERYAADNSFIVKADVGKSGATHDH